MIDQTLLLNSPVHLTLTLLHVTLGFISFWIPATIMVYVYVKVYRETKRLQGATTATKVSLGGDLNLVGGKTLRSSSTSFQEIAQVNQHTIQSNVTKSSFELRISPEEPSMLPQSARKTLKSCESRLLPSSDPQESTLKGGGGGARHSLDTPPLSVPHHQLCIHQGGQQRKKKMSGVSLVSGFHSSSRQSSTSQQQEHMNRESRAATTVGIVMGTFLICWLPFFVWMPLTSILELHTPPVVYSVILWVGYGNSVVNPFIYGFFSREFRQVIVGDLRKMGFAG